MLFKPKVEVTDATTSETVMVLVRVCVEVSVVVNDAVEVSAMASRGSTSAADNVEKRMLYDFVDSEGMSKKEEYQQS